MIIIDYDSEPGSWAEALDRGCLAGRVTEHTVGVRHIGIATGTSGQSKASDESSFDRVDIE